MPCHIVLKSTKVIILCHVDVLSRCWEDIFSLFPGIWDSGARNPPLLVFFCNGLAHFIDHLRDTELPHPDAKSKFKHLRQLQSSFQGDMVPHSTPWQPTLQS